MSQPSDTKRKRGGQPKPPGEKRTKHLATNWTPDEYDQLGKYAKALGLSLNEYVRARTLRRKAKRATADPAPDTPASKPFRWKPPAR